MCLCISAYVYTQVHVGVCECLRQSKEGIGGFWEPNKGHLQEQKALNHWVISPTQPPPPTHTATQAPDPFEESALSLSSTPSSDFWFCFIFKIWSHYVTQPGLELC